MAVKAAPPSIGYIEYANAGELFGYGVNLLALYRHAPVFVDKIVKGAKPADRMPSAAHFILCVADQTRSAPFCATVLATEPRLDVPGMTELPLPGGAILGLMPESGIRELLGPALPDPSHGRGVTGAELYLLSADPGAFHQRALACGAKELSPLRYQD